MAGGSVAGMNKYKNSFIQNAIGFLMIRTEFRLAFAPFPKSEAAKRLQTLSWLPKR
jgi:hypothetical protein